MRATAHRSVLAAATAVSAVLLLGACSSGGTTAGAGGTQSPVAAPQSPGATATGGTTAGGTTTGGTTTVATVAGCQNLVVSADVKTAVTQAFTQESSRGHLVPRPGGFLYGECGGTKYAATAFDPTKDATYNEKVASQDDGSVRKYFTMSASGTWTYVGSADFPDMSGCLKQIPDALAKLWGGCHPVG